MFFNFKCITFVETKYKKGMETVFRKVSPNENNWEEDKVFFGCYGGDILTFKCVRYGDKDDKLGFNDVDGHRYGLYEIDWILEEIQLPTEEDIFSLAEKHCIPFRHQVSSEGLENIKGDFYAGANIVLNKLK